MARHSAPVAVAESSAPSFCRRTSLNVFSRSSQYEAISELLRNPSDPTTQNDWRARKMRNELLLLVFVHGFKGGGQSTCCSIRAVADARPSIVLPADTFGAFPDRITHILTESQPDVEVQPIVYPPFDTRGELIVAGERELSIGEVASARVGPRLRRFTGSCSR